MHSLTGSFNGALSCSYSEMNSYVTLAQIGGCQSSSLDEDRRQRQQQAPSFGEGHYSGESGSPTSSVLDTSGEPTETLPLTGIIHSMFYK